MGAVVVPRAYAPESGEILPLDDLLEAPSEEGAIALLGPPGSGKSVALRYLARRWPGVRVVDDPEDAALGAPPVVYAARRPLPVEHRLVLTLAPWSADELLEYLQAAYPDRYADVMRRLMAAPDRGLPGGSPEIWREALDSMAADDALAEVAAALRVAHGGDPECAGTIALDWPRARARRRLQRAGWDRRRVRLMRHRPVQVVWAVAEILRQLDVAETRCLERVPAPDVTEAAGAALAREKAACEALVARLEQPRLQAAAGTLLHAAGVAWTPAPGATLAGGRFAGAEWPGVDLTGACLRRADLSRANLAGATLDRVEAYRVVARRANLNDAALRELQAREADLAHADLSHARADGADLYGADLTRADLRGTLLEHGRLVAARLRDARLAGADLTRATLFRADIEGADLTGARLDGALLRGVALRSAASVRHATFRSARLRDALLDGVDMPGAVLDDASLSGADLTGAHMPGAHLWRADLTGARAADVCWEGADLKDADLGGVNFHMGSARSGLVDSTVASEGTRTGFYTDDYEEQHFKAPEEIRKANLCHADLRGALVAGTDFYLVDLRGARYTDEQRRHFRRCGAIL